jgi:nitroreductase
MDAYQAIIGKRDRREYDGRPVGKAELHRILQAGRMAGSSGNRQYCRFIVLNDRAVLEKLATAGQGTAPMLKAPLAIAIVLTEGGGPFDVGRCAQNMMVAAWADGIASCPQGIQNQSIAREALGLPDGHTVGMCVAFGYPVPSSAPGEPRPRLPMDEMVHYGKWQASA